MMNNPAPIIYQNAMRAMQNEQNNKQPVIERGGLLGPKKSMTNKNTSALNQPANRVMEYMKAIQAKRQEIKDNGNS
jgi:hypothetical protein